jgi:hypothetical protein
MTTKVVVNVNPLPEITVSQQGKPDTVILRETPMVTVYPIGMRGPPGDNINTDPGDFTLLFDNQLI